MISVHRNKVQENMQEIANKIIIDCDSQPRRLQLLFTHDVKELLFDIGYFCQGLNESGSTGKSHSDLEAWRMTKDPTTFL